MAAGSLTRTSIGPWRVVDYLGAGGMGAVYRVVHSATGQVAAAKVLHAAAVSATGLERFRNEARIHQTLVHPHIARVYEYREVDGVPCLVMEYVDGETLDERLARSGPMPLEQTLRLFDALVDAVGYIHGRGVVHRDLKTNNVKVNSNGTIKLLDFGIAMAPGVARLTTTGNVVGTLQSLAPEQLTTGRAEPRSDIWALGILFYELLTASPPFVGNAPGLLGERILRGAYNPPSEVRTELPRDVDKIVARCLRARPEDRYANAEALRTDVKQLARGEGTGSGSWARAVATPAAVIGASGEMARAALSQWRLLGAGSLAAVALAFLVWSLRPAPTPEVDPRIPSSTGTVSKPAPPELRRVVIRVLEGDAEVWRDDLRIGVTPYVLQAPLGTEVQLILKRAGCDDTPIQLRISEGLDAVIESLRRCRTP